MAGQTFKAAAATGVSKRLVLMLALAMFINYADRGSLAVAAPLLSHDLGIGPRGLGVLLSSFFWSYALAQPLAGMVLQRWPVRWVLAGALVAWSVATMACGLTWGFASLLVLRLVIGVTESVIFPANACILAEHAPVHQRGSANGAISAGLYLGPVAGTLVGGLVLAHYGWHAVFLVLGAVSLLWLPFWLTTRMPVAVPCAAEDRIAVPGWGQILSQRSLWGVAVGQFCYAYPTYLLLTWLPTFLVSSEHYSLTQMAVVGAGLPVGQALGAGVSGLMSDRLIASGRDESMVRKAFLMGGMTATGLMFLGAGLAPHSTVVIWLAAAGFFLGIISPMNFTAGQSLAGPVAAGRWMGAQNLIGNLSGVAAPMVTGYVVEQTGSFHIAFLIPAALAVVGLIAYGPLTGPIRIVAWGARAQQPLRQAAG